MNNKKHFIAIAIALITVATSLIIIAIDDGVQTLQNKLVFAQMISSSASSFSAVHIIKDTTNSYTISSGFTSIGTFDTTYTILGNITSIKNATDLIITTITKDYDSTPTIGYVKVAPQKTSQGEASSSPPPPPSPQPSTIANPFADKATINQRIITEIQKAIESAAKSNFVNLEIKCDFGMDLSDWKCSSHDLLG
ncbi:MAG TPA: hypothetical protein VE244_09365 [Nitrososphaeraceae archaeon]|jgi:hypothetical protein|nr:hypothetical protein [Nitrososphaeraceae archaeon]